MTGMSDEDRSRTAIGDLCESPTNGIEGHQGLNVSCHTSIYESQ